VERFPQVLAPRIGPVSAQENPGVGVLIALGVVVPSWARFGYVQTRPEALTRGMIVSKSTWPVQFAVSADGIDIAYMAEPGRSPPFLVVTPLPAPGRASSGLIPGVEQFCAHFLRDNACYEFEWRGIGLSAKPPDAVTFDSLVADIAAVAEAIGEPFHLMAFGTSSIPALAYAKHRPGSVLSLLLDTPRPRASDWPAGSLERYNYDDALVKLLRYYYDFPPDVVARELLPCSDRTIPSKW
jgi:pimeloyl-ACP methyl ester carboxylesterase